MDNTSLCAFAVPSVLAKSNWQATSDIYIPLRRLDINKGTLDQISKFISNETRSKRFGSSFSLKSLNKEGRLLLLLDGFDEFGHVLDEERIVSNIGALAEIIKPKSKILLTSRGHVFRSMWHAQDLFAKALNFTDFGETIGFEVMRLSTELSSLTDEQIREIVALRLSQENVDKLITWMKNTYNLIDLARRPILLNLIIETFSELQKLPLTISDLYDSYTKMWFHREDWRGSLGAGERILFTESLAWHMFTSDRIIIPYDELTSITAAIFETENSGRLDQFDYDIRTSTFLVRDSQGHFSFAHKSFMEFFTAKWIINSLAKNNSECLKYVQSEKNNVAFSFGVDEFLKDMEFPESVVNFLEAQRKQRKSLGRAATKILNIAKKMQTS